MRQKTGRTHRFHHVKLLPVLHLVDLVDIFHWGLVEVDSLFVQEFIGLRSRIKNEKNDASNGLILVACVWLSAVCVCVWPPEAGSPSFWLRDSRVCPPGSKTFHCLSQTSSSSPARHEGKYKNKCFFFCPIDSNPWPQRLIPRFSNFFTQLILLHFICILTEFQMSKTFSECVRAVTLVQTSCCVLVTDTKIRISKAPWNYLLLISGSVVEPRDWR